MNSGGEAVDDQGSGWLEVKKVLSVFHVLVQKHRSSSKFSLQSWVGGFSGKNASNFQQNQPLANDKSRNLYGKRKSHLPKARGSFVVQGQDGFKNSAPISNEDKKAVNYLDHCAVKDSECSKGVSLFVANSNGENVATQKMPLIDKHDVVQKIKWGDLGDESLVLHHQNNAGAEIKFGDIGPDNLVASRKLENDHGLVSCVSTSANLQQNKSEAMPVTIDSHVNMLTCEDQIVKEKCKEANKILSEDLGVPTANKEVVDQDVTALNYSIISNENNKPINNDNISYSLPSDKEAKIVLNHNVSVKKSDAGEPKISEVVVGDEVTSAEITTQEIEAHGPLKSGPEVCGKSFPTASISECYSPLSNSTHDDLSKAQSISAFGEDNSSESKERFRQRLWCFLFENLNRAVDELYLLCELECDLEQMKEAILVLEEAASDFKELTSRVEEFENVRGSSSQSFDGAPITLKTDHRRPHALSWEVSILSSFTNTKCFDSIEFEVRRMTNSPHKAEILSSSLEAFKKIQLERASLCAATSTSSLGLECSNCHHVSGNNLKKLVVVSDETPCSKDSVMSSRKKQSELTQGKSEKRGSEVSRSRKVNLVQNGRNPSQSHATFDLNACRLPPKDTSATSGSGKSKREHLGSETEKLLLKKEKMLTESVIDKNLKPTDHLKRQIPPIEKDKEKRNVTSWKSMDAWKEKRNWEDILSSPFRVSSRISHSPGMSRKSTERARILRDKLMSPEKKKKTTLDLKKEAEEKHARAMRIRSELETERVQKLQRTSEKLNRVNEWQAVRYMKLREDMFARHQRSELRHEAFLAQVVRRAGDESSKVNEVRFITSLNEENKKLILRQKLHDSELRRAEKLQVLRTKQKEDIAREEAVLERRKLIEAEKLQRLAETQRKKEEAQVRREEERKASSAAREARAIENLRRKEERAKAQQEEAELLAQKLAEKLSESEQRRKFYLEQIRERASMDFRDQSSPLLRRSTNKDGQGRSTPINNSEDYQANVVAGAGGSTLATGNVALQHSLKRRIKRIRQRLMALKYEFPEPPVGSENAGIGYRTAVGTARAKIGRWLQELQKLRQARKEGASSIGLITAEMIKFLEGKDPELQASRQAGLLDFIASALPASHTSKPEACQVTIHLLKLLRVVLSVPSNRSYFLAQNLLPPIIPMLSAALENYIKIAASLNAPGSTNLSSSKVSVENFESISEVLDGFLWTVAAIIGHISSDERQLQMHDGLLELLVTYQVIHRLRDLFALYDRPQVEGSPFPSSILLSISLLVVLTSSPGIISSIDWETSPLVTVPENGSPEVKLAVSADSGFSYANNTCGDSKILSSVAKGSSIVPLTDVPEECLLDESCKLKENESVSIGKDSEKKLDDSSVELHDATMKKTDAQDESCKILNEKDEKHVVDIVEPQKIENISSLKPPMAFLLSAISETGLVSLPSLLTSVLLQANNRLSSEQTSGQIGLALVLFLGLYSLNTQWDFELGGQALLVRLGRLVLFSLSYMAFTLLNDCCLSGTFEESFFNALALLLLYPTAFSLLCADAASNILWWLVPPGGLPGQLPALRTKTLLLSSYMLPSNFEEVATGVLKVLNNLALLDILFLQRMLARPDLKMEFFHLMSFLLSHCTSKWKVASDQVGLLLLECLLLLGYFALFHSGNQAVLRWGKSPTILHKICDLPFVFFSDPELMPILAGTLVAACYGCEQNKGVVQQELSLDMLLSLLRSCRNVLPAVRSNPALENLTMDDSTESNQQGSELRKPQGDIPLRSSRYTARSTRVSIGKGGALGNSVRVGKMRNQRDTKATKLSEDANLKNNPRAMETSLMLHCRFPSSFIDKAEKFFSAEMSNVGDEV
ncbi:hypothetical protein JRO89_XS13G0256300 [Xanthoceras sorbifolium]|uniref:S phase cyclin A-associated protein in the endoplasmic reticulum N-terminal domain-containing protein n=1 Tax=Xanthoceras sorbifolium TaxID=99658 RepID=A0ABQ8H9W7_9ROSI|nr:hypothetical protein JRO89_XS13G0256300 [Xanthoceras sorbifolium]